MELDMPVHAPWLSLRLAKVSLMVAGWWNRKEERGLLEAGVRFAGRGRPLRDHKNEMVCTIRM